LRLLNHKTPSQNQLIKHFLKTDLGTVYRSVLEQVCMFEKRIDDIGGEGINRSAERMFFSSKNEIS
jgi:hypothetical protein